MSSALLSYKSLPSKLLSLIRLIYNSFFIKYDHCGLASLTQLRLGLSKLNLHKVRHNFRDVISPMCPVNDGPEDAEHYLLQCHSFHEQRHDLLASFLPVLLFSIYMTFPIQLSCKFFCMATTKLSF